ncbi:MAG: hypothetical protein FWF90_12665 [Promicromonosporaceae bacterium]|nr:hypothetical protein [Promicromonosporaceae bacterium]
MTSTTLTRTDGRWARTLFLVCGIALVPWMVFLATQLPETAQARHWAAAWIGLDTLEAIGLITTAVLVHRRHPAYRQTAAATATLLFVDAWLDMTTAAPGRELTTAIVLAVAIELPLAAVCAWVAAGLPQLQGRRSGPSR